MQPEMSSTRNIPTVFHNLNAYLFMKGLGKKCDAGIIAENKWETFALMLS